MIEDTSEMVEGQPRYTKDDLEKLGAKWMDRIHASEKREDKWIKDAEKAETAYLCDTQDGARGEVPDFNILHSNVETIVPSIYNSTPTPDIRSRHNVKDDAADEASEILERCISTQIDDSRMDAEVEALAQDAFMAGRGIVRIRFDADEDGEGVTNERIEYENVSWRDYREGPAKRWKDVPWVAFKHSISEEERRRIEDEEIAKALGPEDANAEDEELDCDVWEIWCKTTGKVYLISEVGTRVVYIKDDPLELSGFFPMPEPVQPITATGKRVPVCPYVVYKTLAEELDRTTVRINKIISGLKVRGAIAGDAEAIALISQADDNELVPVGNLEGLAVTGGLDKAVMWWPIETAIAVLRELYATREQTKQAIYEITGISDIIRGQGNASETATAQKIKTEWGSLRVKKMQRLIERQVRGLFVISSEIIASKFSQEALQRASGMEVSEAAAQLLMRPLDHYRIDVESDSTVKADLSKNRAEMGEFLRGTAEFFGTLAPLVQQAPAAAGPVSEMYAAFARQFALGKQAEDAIQQLAEMAKQQAEQPQPNPEEEAMKAQQEGEQARMQMEGQKMQGEMQVKQAELQIKAQSEQSKAQIDAEKLQIDREKLDIDRAKLALEQQKMAAEMQIRSREVQTEGAEADTEEMRETSNAASAFAAAIAPLLQQMQAADEQQGQQVALLATQVAETNQQVLAALSAPKELIRDEAGRAMGVRMAGAR